MENPLISVIIPVYNVEKYLERCVNSVFRQIYRNLEIILVNDGSIDSSPDICRKIQEKHPDIILINKQNGGLGSARNAGIDAANGDFIAFLDSDDWVTPDCYEYMLNLLIKNDADISDVGVFQVYSENELMPVCEEKIEFLEGMKILEHYLYRGMKEQKGAPYSSCRKLYKRDLFQKSDIRFDEKVVSEDTCFNFRILSNCKKIAVSNQKKYFYFQGESSITNGAMKKKALTVFMVTQELVKLAEETGDEKIIELAKMKDARTDFSLLARAAKYGIDERSIENSDELIRKLQTRLKKNLGILLRSPMSSSRKILATAFVINYDISRSIIRFLNI